MQREDMVAAMTDIMANFTSYLGKHLPDDIIEKLGQLRSAEVTPLAKVVYDSMFENLEKADTLSRPCCQDTGVIQFFIKAGADLPLLSDVREILDKAVRRATQAAPLRHNAVEIFVEKNTGNNTGSLRAETSTATNFGIVWQPRIGDSAQLALAVDFFDVDVDDQIGRIAQQPTIQSVQGHFAAADDSIRRVVIRRIDRVSQRDPVKVGKSPPSRQNVGALYRSFLRAA